MAVHQAVEIPLPVLNYLRGHHIITVGTASFTGMPHAATTAYVSDATGIYFSMTPTELTLRNIEANHWASFTIDDYTPDFRKVRELRGVGRSTLLESERIDQVVALFADKLPLLPRESLINLHQILPLELHFVDFEYTEGVGVPMETSIVYEVADATAEAAPQTLEAQLQQRSFAADEVILTQGEHAEHFFIIIDGLVEVRREGHGQDVVVTRHGPGQLFGEVSALTGGPQPATVTAVDATVVLTVHRSAFQELATQSAVADLGQRARDTIEGLQRSHDD